MRRYDILKCLKKGGVFLLNTPDTNIEQLESHLPPKIMRDIATKEAKFYIIDAGKVAKEVTKIYFFFNFSRLEWQKKQTP